MQVSIDMQHSSSLKLTFDMQQGTCNIALRTWIELLPIFYNFIGTNLCDINIRLSTLALKSMVAVGISLFPWWLTNQVLFWINCVTKLKTCGPINYCSFKVVLFFKKQLKTAKESSLKLFREVQWKGQVWTNNALDIQLGHYQHLFLCIGCRMDRLECTYTQNMLTQCAWSARVQTSLTW